MRFLMLWRLWLDVGGDRAGVFDGADGRGPRGGGGVELAAGDDWSDGGAYPTIAAIEGLRERRDGLAVKLRELEEDLPR